MTSSNCTTSGTLAYRSDAAKPNSYQPEASAREGRWLGRRALGLVPHQRDSTNPTTQGLTRGNAWAMVLRLPPRPCVRGSVPEACSAFKIGKQLVDFTVQEPHALKPRVGRLPGSHARGWLQNGVRGECLGVGLPSPTLAGLGLFCARR